VKTVKKQLHNKVRLMINDFLVSPINSFILNVLLYGLIFHTINPVVNFKQSVFILIILVIINILTHMKGISKGMFIATVHRKELDKFMKMMDELEKKEHEDS